MKNLLLLLFPILVCAQTDNEMTIRLLQDRRMERSVELSAFLQSPNHREREMALLAFANIQDTSAVDSIIPLLNDNAPNVRSMAAFALGMVANPRGAFALFRRLSVETNQHCVDEILNGIGMCGRADDLKKLILQTESFKPQLRSGTAAAIMRFANRRIKEGSATQYLFTLLGEKESALFATYALMRTNDSALIRKNPDAVIALLSDRSPLIRMWGATIAGAAALEEVDAKLISLAKRDTDWRVRVNAIRALRMQKKFKNDIITLCADRNEHVAMSAVAAYDGMTASDTEFVDRQKFISILSSKKYSPRVREEVRIILAKRLREEALPVLGDWRSDTSSIAAQRLQAYGATGSVKILPTLQQVLQQSSVSSTIIAALEAYHAVARQSTEMVKKDLLKNAVLLMGRKDPGVSYSAAVLFQDSAYSQSIRKIYLSALSTAYVDMNAGADLEPMVELMNVFAEIGDSSVIPAVEKGLAEQERVIRTAAERAYKAITGNDSPVRFIKNPDGYRPFFTPDDIRLLSKYRGAEIITSKGTIHITFEKEAAPLTVLNFIMLAEKKFYDGLSFHRVVSNFVIQGGDPLGNGSGGPNYALRTEVHPNAKFRTGAVGMASAGKDTEGSQWFVTHCPTPHLDFRYSIFGYTQDAGIVERIMVGDTINRVLLKGE